MVKFVSRFVLVLAMICLVVTALPADGFKVMAATREEIVASNTTWAEYVESSTAGDIVNVRLSASFEVPYDDTLDIPEGVIVNLYMCNQTIFMENNGWENVQMILFNNKGTLNIYAGTMDSPNSGVASLSVNNTRTGMEAKVGEDGDEIEYCTGNLITIQNSNSVVVNSGVSITTHVEMAYSSAENSALVWIDSGNVDLSTMATGIYNTTNTAKCVINAATVNATAISKGIAYDQFHNQAEYAFARSVLGGTVTVNGSSVMSAHAETYYQPQLSNNDTVYSVAEAYCIASAGKITVNGGDFTVSGKYDGKGDVKGEYSTMNVAGIAYYGTNPTITDGNFNIKVNDPATCDDGLSQHSVATVDKVFRVPTVTNPGRGDSSFNTLKNTASSGGYYDETGYLHVPGASNSSGGNAVKTINNGAPTYNGTQSNTRVHLVYRFWETANKKNLIASVVSGTDDSRITKKAEIYCNGSLLTNNVVPNGAKLTVRMYESSNSYYWRKINVATLAGASTTWYNDFADSSFAATGSAIQGGVDGTYTEGNRTKTYTDYSFEVGSSNVPLYIYVDYVKELATPVAATFGAGNVVNVTYTGKSPVPNETPGFDVAVRSANNSEIVWTEDYNLANAQDVAGTLLPVAYSYVNNANAADSGNGLPVNAGRYTVTCTLADDTNIDRDDNVYSKNRKTLTTSFTLNIGKAYAQRGDLIESLTLTYGEKLGDKLSLKTMQAKGVRNESIAGTFEFANGIADSDSYKNVCNGIELDILWKPGADTINYQTTSFTVKYTVTPATLTITPTAAAVVYGNSEFSTPYSATVTGLVANDAANESKIAQILAGLSYTINYTGSDYIAYSAGNINAGSYYIQPVLSTVPTFLSNYNVVYNYGVGYASLAVTARPLTVSAVAQSRAYDPADMTAVVNLTITDGLFEGDIVAVAPVTGNLKNNNVGKQYVEDIDKTVATNALNGADAGNYTVAFLTFEDGAAKPMVEIVKAMPNVTVPAVTGTRYYTYNGKLGDINLNGNDYTPEIAGTWDWAAPETNPQVLVDTYTAVFKPFDSDNYLDYTVEIPVDILASDVHITYNASLTYGDPRPDLTQYTYTCATDTAFSIKQVVTSGNIYPSTTYDQFDGVIAEGYVVKLNNANYKDVNGNYNLIVDDGLIMVSPKPITVTADNAVITYGDRFDAVTFGTHTVSYSDDFVGSDTPNALTKNGTTPDYIFTSDYNYNTNYKVGTYTISVDMLAEDMSPNYQITFMTGTLKVEKAELLVAGKTINVNYLDTVDLSAAYTLTGLVHGETTLAQAGIGEPTADTSYIAGAPVVDGGYPYFFDFTGITSENYRISTKSGTIIVNKINPVITVYPTASIPFGSALADAVFSEFIASVDGKFVFDAADAKPPFSSKPYNEDVVVYTATFVPTDTVNYNVLNNQRVVLTITKGIVSGALMITGYPMEGQTLAADLTAMTPADETYYTYVWTVNGTTVSTEKTYTVANANETVVLTVTATGPYEGSAATSVVASQAMTIADLNTILSIAGLEDKTYNATQQQVTVTNKNASEVLMGNITVKYNGSATIPTNAGTYGVTVDIALPDNLGTVEERNGQTYVGNQKIYAPASNISIGTFTIAPADFDVNVTVADKVYDGTNIATALTTDIVNGAIDTASGADKVSFDAANAIYYFEDANAGTNKAVTVGNVALIGASKDNYVLNVNITNANAGVITKKELTAVAVAETREYEAGNKTVDVAFDMDLTTLAAGDTDADVYFIPATGAIASDKAGTQDVALATGDIVLAGSKAGNYTWNVTNLDTLTVLIDKATPDYPMPEIGILTYDSGRTLDDISLGDSRWGWVNGNVKPGAGTQTYTAVFMPDDTVNYKTITKEVTLVINKAQVVITATSYTLTYGDPAPTYAYTVSGLTGADTLASVATGYAIVNCAYDLGSPVRAEGYPVTVTGYFSGENYDFRYVQGLVTVNPRPLFTNATVTDRNFSASNYDVAINFSELTNVYAPDKGNVSLASYAVTGTVENNAAGTRAVNYTAPVLTGSAAGNYVLVVNPNELTVEILKAKPLNVLMPTTATVIYGSPLSTAVFTSAKEGDGTFRLENASSYPVAHGVFNDVYKVEFVPTDSANYATLSAYITLTVEKKPIAVAAAISGTLRTGETVYVVTSEIEENAAQYVTYEWYRLKNAGDSIYAGVKLAEGINYTLTDQDVDSYIACAVTVRNSAPYSCNAVAVSDSPIEEIKMTFWQKIWAWFYKIFSSITQLFGGMTG